MRINRTTRSACGLMGAMAILSIIYYALMIPPLIRRPKPQPVDYYGPATGTIPSQWGRRSSSTVCGPGGCSVDPSSSDDGGESWMIYSDAWVYKRGGQEQGRIYRNGTTSGFVGAQPSWYPSDMPQQFQAVGKDGPPVGETKVGQLPPTGVNPSKVAEDKARVPSGVTINGSPATESLARSALSDSAKAQGLKDYEGVLRLVVCGEGRERANFVSAAKPWADASNGKLIIQEYEPGDWQCTAHINAVKNLPEYKAGEPFAYVQRNDGTVKAISFSPSEVAHSMKQLRPEIAPNFDAAKARAITQASDSWLIWASAVFVGIMGVIGAVTSKGQQ